MLPQVVSASFEGIKSEVLLHALEDRGNLCVIRFSLLLEPSGSERNAEGDWRKKELQDSTLRFSFGAFNTEEERLIMQ